MYVFFSRTKNQHLFVVQVNEELLNFQKSIAKENGIEESMKIEEETIFINTKDLPKIYNINKEEFYPPIPWRRQCCIALKPSHMVLGEDQQVKIKYKVLQVSILEPENDTCLF